MTATLTPPRQELTAPPPRSRDLRRLWVGNSADPTWARPALLGLLALTAVLYLWDLSASGWGNSFYAAAAQAGSQSWEAFLFGSSDAANAITVDKPPASLWVMALSVRVFGLSSWSILAPQALMGVATVGVVYAGVKRYAGAAAGLLAGLVLALTPVAALMFRFDNPDALLALLMTVAAWMTLRACERGRARWILGVGAIVGLAFLTKQLQALLVVPAYGLTYLVAAPKSLGRRLVDLVGALVAMVVAAGWWVALVELVPATMRPYVGGSQTNSILELTLGYNGLGRLTGNEVGSVGGGGGNGGGNWGATGFGRLFNSEIGGQISWLLPAALILLVAGLWLLARRPRTDLHRASLLLWGTWTIVTALTFSLMAGIFHAYYTVALAPSVAALVGIGAAVLWTRRRQLVWSTVLGGTVVVSAVWAFVLLSRSSDFLPWLRWLVLVLGLASGAGLVLASQLGDRWQQVAAAGALVAVLAGPAAYTVQTVGTAHTGSIVSAGPTVAGAMGGPGGGPGGFPGGFPGGAPGGAPAGRAGGGGLGGLLDSSTPGDALVAALKSSASSYTWAAAAIGSQNASGYQLATQLPVMAVGGFNGSDPSPTLAQFQEYVAQGRIRYFLAGGGMGGGRGGSSSGTSSQISEWVAANFTAQTIDGVTVYDLTSGADGTAATT
jgi:4-amino-4-deoxy-L-arabinose transferase-like glycosyltransferase